MPNFYSILELYEAHASAAASGALENEREQVASSAMDRVARGFLTSAESDDWGGLTAEARAARLRLGRQRLRRWEMSNPDIAALLRRKARNTAIG